MPQKVNKGTRIRVVKPVLRRPSGYKQIGRPERVLISLPAGFVTTAATLSVGGNVFADATDSNGDAVLVPLREREWEPL